MRTEFPDEVKHWDSKPALWSRSSCMMSVGGAPLEGLTRSIEGQAGADEGADRAARRMSPPANPEE
ncbi:hypothetical protein M5E06_33095 [Azospirillum sp. A1-3]|uniref:hypothetical protein n=1 Tax=Azospirillum sp. A1-3 TaxID=185874 RepID=UPI0020778F33|nr:hypothetical protein [Azospirillum sp. A1-3]MCM8738922.1 hypothetical protein [Azospirillum sp. A1-3]